MEEESVKLEGLEYDIYQFNPAGGSRKAGTVFAQPRIFTRRYGKEELDIDAAAKAAEKYLRKNKCAFDKID
jgi:hypothetical protein